jgi:hypothetical protein
MSAENKFYTTFHNKYRFSESSTPLKLIGNSRNSKFLMHDAQVQQQEVNFLLRCLFSRKARYEMYPLIVKVQLNAEDDSITNDILVALALNKYEPGNPHIMKFVTAFMGPIEKIDDNTYNYILPGNPTGTITQPCAVFERIVYSKTLFDLSQTSKLQFEQNHATHLCSLFQNLLYLGDKYAFSHHDMHSMNVLFDQQIQCMVLIDYGRAFIRYKVPADQHLAVQLINDAITVDEYKSKGMISTTENFCQYLRKNREYLDPAYIMNDIGRLTLELFQRRAESKDGWVRTVKYYNMLDKMLDQVFDTKLDWTVFDDFLYTDNQNNSFYDKVISIGLLWVLVHHGSLNIDPRYFGCKNADEVFNKHKTTMSQAWPWFKVYVVDRWLRWSAPLVNQFHQGGNDFSKMYTQKYWNIDDDIKQFEAIPADPSADSAILEKEFNSFSSWYTKQKTSIAVDVEYKYNLKTKLDRALSLLEQRINTIIPSSTPPLQSQPSGITVGAKGGKPTKPKPKKRPGASR